MGLTAKKFVLLLILIAVGLLVLTVRAWPRLARSGPRAVAGRVGLLAACQFMLLGAFAAAVNADFMFYTSWSDLLGLQADSGRVQPVSAGSAPDHLVRGISVRGHEAVHYRGEDTPKTTGRIDSVHLTGQVTGLRSDGYVYLPPEYFAHGAAHRRFPVVVQLTGYPGESRALVKKLKLPQYALAGVRAHRAVPTVYVMLRSTIGSRDLECTDVPGGPQDQTFLAQDVPRAIQQSYRVSGNARAWGIAGDSTGGYCALKTAMENPDRYGAAASYSGYYHALQDVTTGDLYGGSTSVRNANDLFWRLKHLPSPPINALVTTSQTEGDHASTLRFAHAARPPMRVDLLERTQGGHNFSTWTQEVPHVLHWFAGVLKTPGGHPSPSLRPGGTPTPAPAVSTAPAVQHRSAHHTRAHHTAVAARPTR